MTYTKPQVLNVKQASASIMGSKITLHADNPGVNDSTNVAYRSDE